MALSVEDIELLERQGLSEDIRNQLSPVKMIHYLFVAWKDESDSIKKGQLFDLLNKTITQSQGCVEHICDALDHMQKKQKTPKSK